MLLPSSRDSARSGDHTQTNPVFHNNQSNNRISRKRALAFIGVGIAAKSASSSRWPIGLVEASPFYQHRVGRSHRKVDYEHTISQGTRHCPSFGFWDQEGEPASGSNSKIRETSVSRLGTLVEALEGDERGHVVWSLVADAAHQRPPEVTRLKRKRPANPNKDYSLQADPESGGVQDDFDVYHNLDSKEKSTSGEKIRRRRQQVRDKFVEDSTSAVLHEQGESADADHGESTPTASDNNSTISDNNHYVESEAASKYSGYNVTAQVEYNVSEPEDGAEDSSGSGETTSSVLTSSSKLPDNSSSASHSIYQPLRIRAILSEQRNATASLTKRGREILLKDIIRPALLTWSAALRVDPVIGNLTVDERQLFDNRTCGPGMDSGLPSPRVPLSHLTDGIPNTDMILYLNLGFTHEALANMTRFVRNGTTNQDENDPDSWKKNSTKTGNNGRDSDRALGWTSNTAAPSSQESHESVPLPPIMPEPMLCSGDYVAAASYCSTDQYDRPTAGMLHICVGDGFFNRSLRNKQIVTVMHEVGHSLGFNSRSMAHFRRPDGSPITPRVDGEVVETRVECTGPSSSRRHANVALPSEEILQFRAVRGGVRVAEVVTPSVLQVVRNHFDCQNLTGAELESGEYSPLAGDPDEQACIGDHWERRLFQNDLMNPVVDSVEYSPFISTITLAYFADSGWYQVDLSVAQLAASWGRGAGCGFVEETCIGEDGEVPPQNKPFFCNAVPKRTSKGIVQEIDGCTPDLSRKAACALGQYDSALPKEYQYFGLTYGGTVGGDDPFIDYCPTYTGFDNGLCSSWENAALLQVNPIERFGKRNSRCLSGVVKGRQTVALCLPIACVVEDRSLHVKIDGIWRLCESKEQRLKVLEDQYVVCPDPRRVCPTFYCHHDCLGVAGRCDYDTGSCVCSRLNATSITTGVTGERLNNITGICEQRNPFASDMIANQSVLVMPHANSPLSDYYVPFKESLRNDRRRLLKDWQIIVLSFVTVIIVFALYVYFRLKRRRDEGCGTRDTNEDDSPGAVPNPNKDKMIASILVDMRVNANNGGGSVASVAPTNQTAASLCGVESAASAVSSLAPSSLDNDDRSSLASEDVLGEVDVLDSKPKAKCVKRRKRRLPSPFSRD